MYYEVYGEDSGVPLILLHGGGSTIESTFGKVIPILAKSRKVIGVEEQAHGRTSDRNKPIRFNTSADDVAALMDYLKIKQADIFGFSNGASVAMSVAIKFPERVRKLVFASSLTKRSAAPPELWEFIRKSNLSQMPQPLKDAFLKVNPDPDKLKVMHDKDQERMNNFKDINDREIKSIKAETLIISGDRDIAKPEHAVELSKLIPNARLMILPFGHGDYIGEASATQKESRVPEFVIGLIQEFLNGPTLQPR